MNSLTVHQPWASLVAVGAKTIETRSWRPPASVVGERLVIHASKRDPHEHDRVGKFICTESIRHAWWLRDTERFPKGWPDCPLDEYVRLPLGAVVASCVLAAVCQTEHMVWCSDEQTPEIGYRAGFEYPAGPHLGTPDDNPPHRFICAPESERPFSDFSPGRYAWLLEDVKPTTERCPACWGAVQPREGGGIEAVECLVCWRLGHCDPIPATGRQRIWQWKAGE